MSKRKDQHEIEGNELVGWAEQKMGHLKPHASKILLGALVALLLFMGITWFIQWRRDNYAAQWAELNLAVTETSISGTSDRLLGVAEAYPDQKAGMMALQIAGDFDLRTGLQMIYTKRDDGLKLIKRAKKNLQKVVESPANLKTADMQQKSLFSLAYACESLGEFAEAKKYYTRLVEEAPETPFLDYATRGIQRASNPEYATLFAKFTEYDVEGGDAPGPTLPDAPDLSPLDINLDNANTEQPAGGGEFGAEDKDKTDATTDDAAKPPVKTATEIKGEEAKDNASDEEMKKDADKAAAEKAAAEKAAAEKAAAEKAAAEKAAAEKAAAEKAAADKKEADKKEADKKEADKKEADKKDDN